MDINFYSIWPYFACMFLLFVLASTPLLQAADTPAGIETKRIVTMDGMRGILALSVVFHHAAVYHRFLLDGVWQSPPARFFNNLGPVAVALFFMITGFLFWSQLIRTEGRPNWRTLYLGRVFRIGPLYLVGIGTMLAIVAVSTGFHLREPVTRVVHGIVRWLSLGLLDIPQAINGYQAPASLLAGVTWTLQYEWCFYLSMPLLALFTRRKHWHLWFVLSAILFCETYLHFDKVGETFAIEQVVLFLLGMLSASLRSMGKLARLPDPLGSFLVLALLAFALRSESATGFLAPQLALGLVLYLVISGSSVFGLLTTRAAIRLGDISYGIYLLQGLVLAAVLRGPFGRQHDLQSPLDHWLLSLLVATVLIAIATATHLWVERPGILLGKRVGRALSGSSSGW